LIGRDYVENVENDILLLDISNKDEYVWTTTFEPPPPPVSSSPPPSSQPTNINTNTNTNANTNASPSKSNNTGVIIGVFIGSLIGGISLIVGSFFLYKRYKNKERNVAIPTPGEESNYTQEILKIPGEQTIHYQSQQAMPPSPVQPIEPTYNHGQEVTK
jgi:hypothetical protein